MRISVIPVLMACCHAMAAEFVLEPFDSTIGVPLSGSGSGSGWEADSTWVGPTNTTCGANIQFVASGTNSVGIVQSSGGSAAIALGDDHVRNLANAYTVGDDSAAGEHPVIYLSFLFENPVDVAPGHAFRVMLRNGPSTVASFGKEINSSWQLRDSDGFATVTTSYVATYFAVVKLEYDLEGDETTITGYLAEVFDDDLDLADLATYPRTGSLSTSGKVTFDNVSIDTHNNASARIDEIRLGDDLANVAATPDPLLVTADPASFTTDNAPEFVDLTVSNAGATNDLVVTAVTFGGADGSALSLGPLDLPITIPPGDEDVILVDFTPYGTYQPTYSATLDIVSNEPDSPRTVTYQITNNPDPWIQATDSVNFTNNGLAAVYSIPVENTGLDQTLEISAVTVGGLDASAVSGLSFPASLSPGEEGSLDLTFAPHDGLGAYQFTLTVESTDPETPSKSIDVFLDVAEPLISVATNRLDFGLSANNPGPIDLPVTVTNGGGSLDLTLAETTAISGSPAFSIVSPALPIAISPGASQDLTVRFAPGSGQGRFSGRLVLESNDFNNSLPEIALEAFVDPAGTIVARFDFDPDQSLGNILDLDDSGASAWTTSDLGDQATILDRGFRAGFHGNYLAFAARREADAQTPLAPGGNNRSTWSRFAVAPESGGGVIDFTGGSAVVDTYAFSSLGGTTSANWTLYYSTNGGTSWTALGSARQGALKIAGGSSGPVGLAWDLSAIGSQSGPVEFILDPSTVGFGLSGAFNQRDVGFDNLVLSAGSVTPGSGSGAGFASWAASIEIPNDPDYDGSDHDGVTALMEYALGLSPLTVDGSIGTFDDGTLAFTKGTEAVTNGDVAYAIESSNNLVNWTPVDPLNLVEGSTTDPNSISYILPPSQGKLFVRLVITGN